MGSFQRQNPLINNNNNHIPRQTSSLSNKNSFKTGRTPTNNSVQLLGGQQKKSQNNGSSSSSGPYLRQQQVSSSMERNSSTNFPISNEVAAQLQKNQQDLNKQQQKKGEDWSSQSSNNLSSQQMVAGEQNLHSFRDSYSPPELIKVTPGQAQEALNRIRTQQMTTAGTGYNNRVNQSHQQPNYDTTGMGMGNNLSYDKHKYTDKSLQITGHNHKQDYGYPNQTQGYINQFEKQQQFSSESGFGQQPSSNLAPSLNFHPAQRQFGSNNNSNSDLDFISNSDSNQSALLRGLAMAALDPSQIVPNSKSPKKRLSNKKILGQSPHTTANGLQFNQSNIYGSSDFGFYHPDPTAHGDDNDEDYEDDEGGSDDEETAQMAQMVAALRQEFSELKKKQIFIDSAARQKEPVSHVHIVDSPNFQKHPPESNILDQKQPEIDNKHDLPFKQQSPNIFNKY